MTSHITINSLPARVFTSFNVLEHEIKSGNERCPNPNPNPNHNSLIYLSYSIRKLLSKKREHDLFSIQSNDSYKNDKSR